MGSRFRNSVFMCAVTLFIGLSWTANVSGAVSIASFTPSVDSPVRLGTSITFTVSATDPDAGNLRYRYRVGYNGSPSSTIVDYGPSNTFVWTPWEAEGTYEIEVTVVNRATGSTASAAVPVTATSLAIFGGPMVNLTAHPLVALYSAPPCAAGLMRVRFKMDSEASWHMTSTRPCNGQTSTNFYVAGMYQNSTYRMVSDVISGSVISTSVDVTFTTGPVSASVLIPATSTTVPSPTPTFTTEGVTLLSPLYYPMYAVDSNSNLLWYLPGQYYYGTRPAPGGTFLVVYGNTQQLETSGFREYDLAGNVVRDTNVEQVNAQLKSMGLGFTTTCFHHEVRKLNNGNYLVLAQTEKMSDAQGPGLDILGDVILLLDSNLQVLWTWNSFDHLDVTRKAVLGETCPTFAPGCVGLLAPVVNDWTHSNSVSLTPDGNLVLSSRHQDFVYKLAYMNGTGDGHVMWRLGKDGDFLWNSSDPYPWQSHQHDAEFESTALMTLYDNGNTRVQSYGGNSRGMALLVNEANLTVAPVLNVDLGGYSAALGAAQRLLNGNYLFDSGVVGGGAQSTEVTGSGTTVTSVQVMGAAIYRTFRLCDLYSARMPSLIRTPPRRGQQGAVQ